MTVSSSRGVEICLVTSDVAATRAAHLRLLGLAAGDEPTVGNGSLRFSSTSGGDFGGGHRVFFGVEDLDAARRVAAQGRDAIAEQTLAELAGLVGAADGRTLGLFSSMRAAREAAEAIRARCDHPVLCQGEDTTAALVRTFADDPQTCLFGTLSLWQGVDVPGPSCSLVVIDRIPFPRPDDPLLTARQRAVEARGGNGFLTVAANHAALLLAQGAGRLLRSTDDRGVVAVGLPAGRVGRAPLAALARLRAHAAYFTSADKIPYII